MEILENLIHYDKQFLLYLHSKGNTSWDAFWLFITNPLCWIPLFFLLSFLGYKAFGIKKAGIISLFIAVSAIVSLLIVNSIKNTVERLRPLNDSSINDHIRVLMNASDFSFVSGHSTVSFTIAFISFWTLKNNYKYSIIIFLFPFLFAYSRLYLAAHFPIDIFFGMILGYGIALFFYKLLHKFILKPF